ISMCEQFARDFDEVFLVVRPAQPAGEFQILSYVVVGFTKEGIGIQVVRVLAQEIVVTLIVQLRQWVWINIAFAIFHARRNVWICIFVAERNAVRIVGDAWHPRSRRYRAETAPSRKGGERVEEDVVVFLSFIVKVVAACTKVQRPREVRTQPQFLADLPGMFF